MASAASPNVIGTEIERLLAEEQNLRIRSRLKILSSKEQELLDLYKSRIIELCRQHDELMTQQAKKSQKILPVDVQDADETVKMSGCLACAIL